MDTASTMSTDKQYKTTKQMGWYQKSQRNYLRKKYGPNHWWAILFENNEAPKTVCVKCGIICRSREEYEHGGCDNAQEIQEGTSAFPESI